METGTILRFEHYSAKVLRITCFSERQFHGCRFVLFLCYRPWPAGMLSCYCSFWSLIPRSAIFVFVDLSLDLSIIFGSFDSIFSFSWPHLLTKGKRISGVNQGFLFRRCLTGSSVPGTRWIVNQECQPRIRSPSTQLALITDLITSK